MRPADGAQHDDLRRRLYRPGASEVDVRRYLGTADPPGPSTEAEGSRRPRRRRWALVVPLVLAAAAAAAVLLPGPLTVRPGPAPTPSTAAAQRLEDVGDGQVLAVAPGAVGVAREVAVTVRGRAVAGQEFEGRGDAVVAVVPPGVEGGGRVQVTATSNGRTPVAWRALLTITRPDGSASRVVMARGISATQPDVPASATFVYARHAPTQVAVSAPSGVRWTLQVGVAAGLDDDLR